MESLSVDLLLFLYRSGCRLWTTPWHFWHQWRCVKEKCLSLFYISLGYLLNWFAFSIPSAEAGLNLTEGDIVIHGVCSWNLFSFSSAQRHFCRAQCRLATLWLLFIAPAGSEPKFHHRRRVPVAKNHSLLHGRWLRWKKKKQQLEKYCKMYSKYIFMGFVLVIFFPRAVIYLSAPKYFMWKLQANA